MNRKGFTLIELLVVIAIIAILAAILFPVFAQVREKARQINCTSNLKQIGLAIIQYQQDYDGYFPGGIDTNWQNAWPSNVQPYVKSIAVFSCPDDTNQSLIAGKQFGQLQAQNNIGGQAVRRCGSILRQQRLLRVELCPRRKQRIWCHGFLRSERLVAEQLPEVGSSYPSAFSNDHDCRKAQC